MLKVLLLATLLLLPSTALADNVRYKVIYLAFDAADVAEGKQAPIVMNDGLLLSPSKSGPALTGCQPMKECFGTFEVPVLSEMLNTMYKRGWELVSIQPVTSGELKGGYLAFLQRTILAK